METFGIIFQNPLVWAGGLALLILALHYSFKRITKVVTTFILLIAVGIYYLPFAIESVYGFLGWKIDIENYLPDPSTITGLWNGLYTDYINQISQPRLLPLIFLLIGIFLSVDLAKNIPNKELKKVSRDYCYFLTIALVVAAILGLITGWGIKEFLLAFLSLATLIALMRAAPEFLHGFWTILKFIYSALILAVRFLALITVKVIKSVINLITYPSTWINRALAFLRKSGEKATQALDNAHNRVSILLENERLDTRDRLLPPTTDRFSGGPTTPGSQ